MESDSLDKRADEQEHRDTDDHRADQELDQRGSGLAVQSTPRRAAPHQ